MTEIVVQAPTSYLIVRLNLEKKDLNFGLLRSALLLRKPMYDKKKIRPIREIPVPINKEQVVLLNPGEYEIRAVIGQVMSPIQKIILEPSITIKIVFNFGET